MYKSNKIMEGTGLSSTSLSYQIGAGHVNALAISCSAPAQVTLQVMLRGEKSEVLINNITLDRLQGISDHLFGCGSASKCIVDISQGTDNEATIESAYPEYLSDTSQKVGIIVPLGSIYLKNGLELHVNIQVGTSTDIAISEISYNAEPHHYLSITQFLTTNEIYKGVVAIFAHRTTYNHSADVQITNKRFGSSINSLEQMNVISALMGKSEALRNYYSTCVYKSFMGLPEEVSVKYTGTNASSIYTLVMTKNVSPVRYVNSLVENQALIASNPVVQQVENVKKSRPIAVRRATFTGVKVSNPVNLE